MSVSFSELPLELIENTFRLLDYNTLFLLRKVCKVTKCISELTILNQYRNPVIDCIDLSGESDNNIEVNFIIDNFNKRRRFLAKLCIVSVINYLRIDGFEYHSEKITNTMTTSEIASFFTQLASLMSEATVNSLKFHHASLKIFSNVSIFFEQKSVPHLTFKLSNSEEAREYVLQTVRQLQSTDIRLILDISIYRIDVFLVHLAGIVDAITISAPIDDYSEYEEAFPFWHLQRFARDILNSRCSSLDISNAFFDIPIFEARHLSHPLSAILWKKFILIASTSEAAPHEEFPCNMAVSISNTGNSSKNRMEIGYLNRP